METAVRHLSQLTARLSELDHIIATATHERLLVIAEIDRLVTPSDASPNQTREAATAIAGVSKCAPRSAVADVFLARQYAAQKRTQEALVSGEITLGQLGHVTTLAAGADPEAVIEFAKTGTFHALTTRAAAHRNDRIERERAARTNRSVRFAENDDQTVMTMIASGPWHDLEQLKQKLDQAAKRLGRHIDASERDDFDTRMYDALMSYTTGNIVVAKPRAIAVTGTASTSTAAAVTPLRERVPDASTPTAITSATTSARPTLVTSSTVTSTPVTEGHGTSPVTEGHGTGLSELPSGATENIAASGCSDLASAVSSVLNPADLLAFCESDTCKSVHSQDSIHYCEDPESNDLELVDDREPFPDLSENDDGCDDLDSVLQLFPTRQSQSTSGASPGPTLITKSDAKIIVHVDITDGTAKLLNGPPLTHPRLEQLLCFSDIDLIGLVNGHPVGLATNQRTKTPAQARYIVHRDGNCRTPGCPGIGTTEFHHLTHYALNPEGGTTTEDTIGICPSCHADHHHGRVTITGNAEGTVTFTYPDGRILKSTITKPNLGQTGTHDAA